MNGNNVDIEKLRNDMTYVKNIVSKEWLVEKIEEMS